MSITVYEATKLNHLKPFKLIAGISGMSKSIDKVGILDYEVIEGINGMFTYGDFVLTTFTPIRNDINAIKSCIKTLIECNVACLAIKQKYIQDLPEDIISYANKNAFPIFLFNEDIYFEDIIEDLLKGLQSRSHIEILETKIEALFKNELKPNVVKELAYDLNRHFYNEHQVFFLKEKRFINDDNIISIAEKYKRSRNQFIEHSVFKYGNGLIVIMTYQSIEAKHVKLDREYIFNNLSINHNDFYIGYSNIYIDIISLDKSIKESIYASQACELNELSSQEYCNIGIYKLLLPNKGSWMKRYVHETLNPLYCYDDGKLLETAREYIINKGDITKTSQVMFQHKNTIRYRIQKMKTLLELESDSDFYEQLSIALKCEKLLL
ncbi:PucR family transcriptional regulator [Clostridiaceae bacterium M8S5]|nr:PucR family transcriptional regulator [Clostridiaceae bacterium M8S5]